MAKDKVRMPSSEGGLVRYYDEEYKSKVMLSPQQVLYICAVIVVGLIALRLI